MAGFNGLSFIYDGVPSEKYGVFICEFDNNDDNDITAEEHTVESYSTIKSYIRYFNGYGEKAPLTFEITIASEDMLDTYYRSRITKWLVGRNGYKKLRIIQPDMMEIYYNCIFTKQRIRYVGKVAYAMTLTAECDSPYQHGENRTVISSLTGNGIININCYSDIEDYIYPRLSITMPSTGGDISITNLSDNNRITTLQNLSSNEEIIMDSQRHILTSSTGKHRVTNFNKNWLRLTSGKNQLSIQQTIPKYTYTVGNTGLPKDIITYDPDTTTTWNIYNAYPTSYVAKKDRTFSKSRSDLDSEGYNGVATSTGITVEITENGQFRIATRTSTIYNLKIVMHLSNGDWIIPFDSAVNDELSYYYRATKNLDYEPFSLIKYIIEANSYGHNETVVGTVTSTDSTAYPTNGYRLDSNGNMKWYIMQPQASTPVYTPIVYYFLAGDTYYYFQLENNLSSGDEIFFLNGNLSSFSGGVETALTPYEGMGAVDLSLGFNRTSESSSEIVDITIITPTIRRVGA